MDAWENENPEPLSDEEIDALAESRDSSDVRDAGQGLLTTVLLLRDRLRTTAERAS